jgi:DNA-binding response OmpR family regulator
VNTSAKDCRRILVVDDDRKTVASIKLYLEHAGYQVSVAHDGRQAVAEARSKPPDLLLLDLMLPEIGGVDVCRIMRAESAVPIIMLTSRATEEDKLRGLDLGADDYVTKPFSPRELVARVRAVLRRTTRDDHSSIVEISDLIVDANRHEVRMRGQTVPITPTEFKLLETLAKAPGRTFTRQELVQRAFGWDYDGLDRTVDAHIMNLRKKLDGGGKQPSMIATVFGVGYKLRNERSGADNDS